MAEESQIKYTYIPNEICFTIDVQSLESDQLYDAINDIDTTCLCIIADTLNWKSIRDFIIEDIRRLTNKKIALFVKSDILPFYSQYFDYIKINDGLYMNVTEGSASRFINITKDIVSLETLDPLHPYYFEMFYELNNEN